MVFETFIRYVGLAVGLKPSAMGCEARLRGLYRIIPSGIGNPAWSCSSPQLDSSTQSFGELSSCGDVELSQCDAIKWNRYYVCKDHKPSAMGCEARLRGLYRIMYSKTINPPGPSSQAGAGKNRVSTRGARW